MIVELALGVAVVLVVSTLARVASERVGGGASGEGEVPEPPARVAQGALTVGDVLLHEGESLWLAGALELEEEGRVMRLFRAPASEKVEWVAQLDERSPDLVLLRASTEVPEGRVPDRLLLGGRPLALERRGRVVIDARGEHLPSVPTRADYVVLAEPGGRVAFVLDGDRVRLALVGDRVARERFDHLPGGAASGR